jgi:hypothetical protein
MKMNTKKTLDTISFKSYSVLQINVEWLLRNQNKAMQIKQCQIGKNKKKREAIIYRSNSESSTLNWF